MSAGVHEYIDELLAADLHGDLSEAERAELHNHLMECAECRLLHKEEQIMNKALQSTMEFAKPVYGFEQRMLNAFRHRAPSRTPRVSRFFVNAMRSRFVQVATAVAALLALMQIGRVLTGESATFFPTHLAFSSNNAIAPIRPAVPTAPREQAQEDFKKEVAGATTNGHQLAGTADDRPDVTVYTDKDASNASVKTKTDGRMYAPGAPPPVPLAFNESTAAASSAAAKQTADQIGPNPSVAPSPPLQNQPADNRKLVRNATVDLEVKSFDEAIQSVTSLAAEGKGYVATGSSQKLENGKLRGQIMVKVLPENLDAFLGKLRGLGELKNLTIGTQDVTKQYYDAEARLRNERVLEQRLVDMMSKNAGRVSDLLEVEKELGRVREQIERLQGELKFMESQVQYATVTINIAEKDMNTPAGFLIKERTQLSLFAPDVERTFGSIKDLASARVQITNATLDRDNSGRVAAHISMLISPEVSNDIIGTIRAMGRVANLQTQTERVSRGGEGMAEEAKTERDKVELNITITREEDEAALQQTSLRIQSGDVNAQAKQLRELAEKAGGKIRSSSFSKNPNGVEFANVSLRVPLKNYPALMQSLNVLGKLEDISVHREDRPGTQVDEATAPADVNVQVYSQGNIVSEESQLVAVLRRTLAQSVTALMYSLRMIGVALASIVPWATLAGILIAIIAGVRRSRRRRSEDLT